MCLQFAFLLITRVAMWLRLSRREEAWHTAEIWHASRSLNEMSGSLGVDRKTIRKYIAPALAAGIAPGSPAKSEGEWQDLVREWFPELADTRLRQVTWPAIGEHHEYITAQLKAGCGCRRSTSGCGTSTGWRRAWRASAGM